MKTLAHMWTAIWPNLAANVLWVPVAALHHVLLKRHVRRAINDTKESP